MTAKTGFAVLLLLLATGWAAAQQHGTGKPSSPTAASETQARAADADLQKMRTLVQQMQMNLVSLPPGPTPLRHQFELDIEMWQTLIAHIGRQQQPAAPKVEH